MDQNLLIQSLEGLDKLHGDLLELALNKTEVLKSGDMVQLKEITREEQIILNYIDKLETTRNEVIREIAPDISEPKLQDILSIYNPIAQKKLTDLRQLLEDKLVKLKEVNYLNQQLIYQSMQLLNVSLSMIRPTDKQYNYAMPGKKTSVKNSSRLFNSEV